MACLGYAWFPIYLVYKCGVKVLWILAACAGDGDPDQIAPGDHLIGVYTVCQKVKRVGVGFLGFFSGECFNMCLIYLC